MVHKKNPFDRNSLTLQAGTFNLKVKNVNGGVEHVKYRTAKTGYRSGF